jgi:hypothetical protein
VWLERTLFAQGLGRLALFIYSRIPRPYPEEIGVFLDGAHILREFMRKTIPRADAIDRAYRNAFPAVDAGIWIDIEPGPFRFGYAVYNAFHRTSNGAGAIAYTQIKNNMCHVVLPLLFLPYHQTMASAASSVFQSVTVPTFKVDA